jgi:hypothetical protein
MSVRLPRMTAKAHPPQEIDTTPLRRNTYLMPRTGFALAALFLLGLFSMLGPADCADGWLWPQRAWCTGNFSSSSPNVTFRSSNQGDLTVCCGDRYLNQPRVTHRARLTSLLPTPRTEGQECPRSGGTSRPSPPLRRERWRPEEGRCKCKAGADHRNHISVCANVLPSVNLALPPSHAHAHAAADAASRCHHGTTAFVTQTTRQRRAHPCFDAPAISCSRLPAPINRQPLFPLLLTLSTAGVQIPSSPPKQPDCNPSSSLMVLEWRALPPLLPTHIPLNPPGIHTLTMAHSRPAPSPLPFSSLLPAEPPNQVCITCAASPQG